MARLNPSPIRMYRGTTAQHSQYAGPIGELTVDTDKNTVVVQNGTQGGVPLAQEKRQVIAGAGITVNGGASGTLASDLTVAVDTEWLTENVPAGEQGPQGDPGPAGADGAAATIAVGSVTTGEAGTQASVTNAGTSSAAVLNFTIPRGAKGDKGDKGDAGPQGEKGEQGEQGPVGPAGEYTAGDGITISGDTLSVNNTVVRTSGAQTISGKKIFNTGPDFASDICIRGESETNDSPYIDFQPKQALSKGDTPSHNYSSGLMVYDSESSSANTHEFAGLTFSVGTNNEVKAELYTNKNVADDRSMNKIVVVSPQSGEPYATAPSTRTTPVDNEIITYDYFVSHMGVLVNKVPGTWYQRDALMTTNKTSVTIPANTQVAIDGKFFSNSDAVTLQTAGVASAGTDIYVYAVDNSGQLDFVLSANSTVPSGYNATNSRKIGGMHCLCADVGTIEGHPLSGYVAGDILPASVWDLKHRARSENEGMVYIAEKGIWVDIYLSSWDGDQLVSFFGGTMADSYSATPFHADKFTEEFGNVGKRNPWRHEFQVFAKGSNEGTNIQGTADPGTTGGHTDTAGRRMISKDGLEDCCGVLWQWAEDVTEGGAYGTYTKNSGNYYLTGYNWNMAGDWTSGGATNPVNAVWNPVIDGDGTAHGGAWGLPRRLRVGAHWSGGLRCGSRAVSCTYFPAIRDSSCGGRGVSEPRPLGA